MKYVNFSKNEEIRQLVEEQNINAKDSHKKKGPLGKIVGLVISLCLLLIISGIVFGANIKNLFNPVTIASNISKADLRETDGRTNILLLGSDRRASGTVSTKLTDTIIFASIGKVEKDIVMISLPRDLYVKSPDGRYSKINEVFYRENSKGGERQGPQNMKTVVEEVTGMPVHYYAVVDFELFKESIDILGGVEVNVDKSFTDNLYPVEGMENAPVMSDRYETVRFEAGPQKMDGATALKYVRSRKGDNNEGTDFARSARQQKVILAIRDKVFSLETIVNPAKYLELYESYKQNIDMDLELKELQGLYVIANSFNREDLRSVVLDDRSEAEKGGLLYAPEISLYNAYVLIPKTGDYSQIHAYVQRYVFGE